MLAPVLEGEAGEDPKGGALVGLQGEGGMRGAKVGLELNELPVGAGDWERFLVVWV